MEFPLQSATNYRVPTTEKYSLLGSIQYSLWTHSWTLSKQNTLEYLYKTLLLQVFFTSLQVSTEGFGALELIWTGGSQREYFQNLYNNIKMRDLTSKLRDQHQCRGTSTSAEGLEHSAPYWGQVHSAEEL